MKAAIIRLFRLYWLTTDVVSSIFILQDVAYAYALGHALPRMPCDSEVQRIIESYHLAQLFQTVIDAVQDAIVLLPLFARAFSRNEREEEGRTFPFVTVDYFLHWWLPRHGDFLAGEVLAVGKPTIADVSFCQAEDVIAFHALGIDREQENVAGKDDLPWLATQV